MNENDIFTNQKDVVDNLKESASNLGIDPNKVVPPDVKKKQVLVAKKNCKSCYGRGVLTIAGHDVAVRTKEKDSVSSNKRGKFTKTKGRNSCKKELSEPVKALIYCKCVRPIFVDADLQTTT